MVDNKSWVVLKDSLVEVNYNGANFEAGRIPNALKFTKSSSSSIMMDAEGVLWFNDGGTLVRFDSRYSNSSKYGVRLFLSKVSKNTNGERLFEGIFTNENGQMLSRQPAFSIPVLDYDDRNISIQVSASDFVNPEAVQYRFMLDGTGNEWSDWDYESTRVFSTLTEGDYVFRAQAKDEVGRISEEVVYAFSILPPWFRTKWAYLGYLLLAVGALISANKYLLMRRAHKAAKEQALELERNREVVKKLQEMALAKAITLEVIGPENRLLVSSDSQALSKVVHNLLSNAVKFTEEGEIEIQFRENDEHISMTVRDTGIGIDAQFLPDLFDAFIQELDGLSRSHEGTGLGLAICSGLVSLMDSTTIRVESTKGEGTTFIVGMPKAFVPIGKKVRVFNSGFGATA